MKRFILTLGLFLGALSCGAGGGPYQIQWAPVGDHPTEGYVVETATSVTGPWTVFSTNAFIQTVTTNGVTVTNIVAYESVTNNGEPVRLFRLGRKVE